MTINWVMFHLRTQTFFLKVKQILIFACCCSFDTCTYSFLCIRFSFHPPCSGVPWCITIRLCRISLLLLFMNWPILDDYSAGQSLLMPLLFSSVFSLHRTLVYLHCMNSNLCCELIATPSHLSLPSFLCFVAYSVAIVGNSIPHSIGLFN